MNWKFWTWGKAEQCSALRPSTLNSQLSTRLRTGFGFGVELTQDEQRAIAAAFEVAGERLEDQPQFGAVVLLAEQMFRLSHDAVTGGAIGEVNDAALREQVAYQRALRDLVGQLRMAWDKARPKS